MTVGFAFSAAYTRTPKTLRAGSFPIEDKTIVLLAGQAYQRGDALGVITASGKYTLCAKSTPGAPAAAGQPANPDVAIADGSQVPVGILEFDVDATAADTNAEMYVSGDFDVGQMRFGHGWTADTLTAAFAPPIFLKKVTLSY